ncbi:MAG: response regulator transcription factor [Desulfarculus sp.]|nr:response regulator transcription factor [Desulfarculus sp.]
MKVRIILADDHPIMLEGLKALLEREPDMEVVGLVMNGRDAVCLTNKLAPDIVIMDVSMPELNGIEATRQILAQHPNVKVIALTNHSAARYAMEMLKAGARGYIPKQCAYEELSRAVPGAQVPGRAGALRHQGGHLHGLSRGRRLRAANAEQLLASLWRFRHKPKP